MQKPVLVVMAAGMGSRYGGLKQLDPVGPGGQLIIDYSLFDAHRAGFETVIFVIKPEIEAAFRAESGTALQKRWRFTMCSSGRMTCPRAMQSPRAG